MPERNEKIALVTFAFAVLASLLILYAFSGPSWDLIAHYLNAKTLLGQYSGGRAYFELYRAPLGSAIMAIVGLAFSEPILPYLILLLAFSLYAIYRFAQSTGSDPLLSMAFVMCFYAVSFFFIPNSTEMLSLAMVIMAVSLLVQKNELSGLFLGLAAISKYPAMIFLPMVLLLYLEKPKQRWAKLAKGIALELLPIIPWLLLNYALSGNPIASYTLAMGGVLLNNTQSLPDFSAMVNILFYPALYALGIALAYAFSKTKSRIVKKLRLNDVTIVLYSFLLLAIAEYAVMGGRYDTFTQIRYGSYLFGALALLAAHLATIAINPKHRYVIVRLAAAALAVMLLFNSWKYTIDNSGYFALYNPLVSNSVFYQAKVTSNTLLQGCGTVSNAWIYMLYENQTSYAPFESNDGKMGSEIISAFYGRTDTAYLLEQNALFNASELPALYFKGIGIPTNVSGEPVYNSTYFAIYSLNSISCR